MHTSTRLAAFAGSVVTSLVLSVACTTHSPSAPSSAAPQSAATPAAVSGTTIAGTVSVASSTSGVWRARAAAPNLTVAVKGTSLSAPVGADGSFTLSGVPSIDITLQFAGPGVDATLPLGSVATDDHVQITVTVSGDTATLNSQQRTSSDNTVHLDGPVTSVTGSCPTLALGVRDVRVYTTSATTFSGKSCGDVTTGDIVAIVGTASGNGTVTSATVTAKAPATPPPPVPTPAPAPPPPTAPPPAPPTPAPTPTPPPTTVTFTGTVSSLSGSCPSLTFVAASTKIVTNSSTTFTGKGCGDLRNGDTVGVGGPKQSDGTVVAVAVSIKVEAPPPPATVTMSGSVSSLTGSCPSLAFVVSSTKIVTNGSTTFAGKPCGDLKNGDTLGLAGTRQSDGTVVATYLSITPTTAPPPPSSSTLTFSGVVSGLTGTCPVISMTVGTTKVQTTSTTQFGGKTCSAIKNGDTAGVAGTKQDNGTVTVFYVSVNP